MDCQIKTFWCTCSETIQDKDAVNSFSDWCWCKEDLKSKTCSCDLDNNVVCHYHLLVAGVPFTLDPETLEITFEK